ncbi:MAG: hypothetical protein CMM93_06750 [Rickettsiales bacterium]|nr:hypothetical protein [Rickettsiales bacterium]|tara:strand:- start:1773 stop:2135 length:363 start_codon:yes stop_codon:yes gene_type:complete
MNKQLVKFNFVNKSGSDISVKLLPVRIRHLDSYNSIRNKETVLQIKNGDSADFQDMVYTALGSFQIIIQRVNYSKLVQFQRLMDNLDGASYINFYITSGDRKITSSSGHSSTHYAIFLKK